MRQQLLLILLLTIATVQADDKAKAERPAEWATPIAAKGLPNFHKVSDELYRGAQPEAAGFQELDKRGITLVVNLRSFHSDRKLMKGTDLAYKSLTVQAWDAEDKEIRDFLKLMADKKNHPVFVHCQHGADRTGMMSAIYRICVQGWSKEDAIKEMSEGGYGFHAVWQNLLQAVRDLDVPKTCKAAGLPVPEAYAPAKAP